MEPTARALHVVPRRPEREARGSRGRTRAGPGISAQTDHIVHVCAGSGIVSNFSMLKFAVAHHPNLRHTFVYSNKTWSDVIFRDELARLAAQHPDRLTLLYALTREEDASVFGRAVRKGRVDRALLREAIPHPAECSARTASTSSPSITT
jgi:ferredoxin-NADP reductase